AHPHRGADPRARGARVGPRDPPAPDHADDARDAAGLRAVRTPRRPASRLRLRRLARERAPVRRPCWLRREGRSTARRGRRTPAALDGRWRRRPRAGRALDATLRGGGPPALPLTPCRTNTLRYGAGTQSTNTVNVSTLPAEKR